MEALSIPAGRCLVTGTRIVHENRRDFDKNPARRFRENCSLRARAKLDSGRLEGQTVPPDLALLIPWVEYRVSSTRFPRNATNKRLKAGMKLVH